MSITYSLAGDTWADLSLRAYGTLTGAADLAAANPGLIEPLAAGLIVEVPPDPNRPEPPAPTRRQDLSASVPKIVIAGRVCKVWTGLEIKLEADGIRSATVTAPWIPTDPEYKAMFKPFAYQPVRISVRGKTILTGYGQNPAYSSGEADRQVSLAVNSLPGVLFDCTPPLSAFPLSFKKQRLDAIAKKVCSVMGVSLRFGAQPGAAFDEVTLEPGASPGQFLVGLAQRRGLLVTDDTEGKLWITSEPAASGKARADLKFGTAPLIDCGVQVDGGAAFSDVTGWRPATAREAGAKFTVKNPHLKGIRRSIVFRADSTEGGSIRAATEAKAARMFPAMATWSGTFAAWDDQTGGIWAPLSFVNLYGPEVLVYNKTKMLIRSVSLKRSEASESATVDLVLPGSFSGKIPGSVPWL